jgi:hypothetical protein
MQRVVLSQSSPTRFEKDHQPVEALVRELNRDTSHEHLSGSEVGPVDPTSTIDDQHRLSRSVEGNLEHPKRLPQLIDEGLFLLTRGLIGQDKGRRVAANDQLPSTCLSATMKCSLSMIRPSAQ